MTADVIYGYVFDITWFLLITCAAMVSAAGVIVFAEDIKGDMLSASGAGGKSVNTS